MLLMMMIGILCQSVLLLQTHTLNDVYFRGTVTSIQNGVDYVPGPFSVSDSVPASDLLL